MGLPLETVEYYDNGGGADYKSSPTKVKESRASYSLNIDYTKDGSIRTRYGSRIVNSGNQIAASVRCMGIFDYRKTDTGSDYELAQFGDDLYLNYSNPVAQGFTLDTSAYPCFEFLTDQNDEYLYYGNGVNANQEFDGTTWRNWSIVAPAAAPVAADNGGGTLVAGNYSYYYTYARYDAANGVILKESPLSPVSNTLALGAAHQIRLTITASADAQVNARIIYRQSPTLGVYVRHSIIQNNVDLTYDDNTATNGTITIEEESLDDNVNVPLTSVFAEYNNRIFFRDEAQKTDLRYTVALKQWNAPIENVSILDGRITAIKRFFGALIIGTDRSIWIFRGDPDSVSGSELRRISSKVGILNNRCVAGESALYFISTTRKLYAITPTDLTEDEIQIDRPLSTEVDSEFSKIALSQLDRTSLEYFTDSESSKVYVSYNAGTGNNQDVLVYNETQSIAQQAPVWQPWNHLNIEAIKQVQTNNQNRLIFGDDNGFIWKLEDSTMDGDGAEVNGTATGGTNNTLSDTDRVDVDSIATAGGADFLTDATQAWIVNEHAAEQLYIYAGTGIGQTRTIQSNTADTLTVSAPWVTPPDATSQYYIGGFTVNAYIGMKIDLVDGTGDGQTRTILSNTPVTITVSTNWPENPDATTEFTVGGYDTFHFSNWKFVLENFDVLKQLWYIWLNANANGDYDIQMIIQTDFDESLLNQSTALVNLSAENAIWSDGDDPADDPDIEWGSFIWGSRSVFQDRFRLYLRFRAIRVGFRNRFAGQPWQINGFSITAQNKGLFFGSAD